MRSNGALRLGVYSLAQMTHPKRTLGSTKMTFVVKTGRKTMNQGNFLTIGLQMLTKYFPAWRAMAVRSLALLIFCVLAGSRSQAAIITWQSPAYVVGDTDVSTLGTSLLNAYALGTNANTITINTVPFAFWASGGTSPSGNITTTFAAVGTGFGSG